MSMRNNPDGQLTICEVLRMINDSLQAPEFSKQRDLLALAETMAKKMSSKLRDYNKEYDKDWWENNPEYDKKLRRDLDTYLVGTP